MEHNLSNEMGNISSQLQKSQQQARELTNYSAECAPNTKLSKEEQEIQKVQNSELPVQFLSDTELGQKIRILLFTIHVITGWKLPEEDAHSAVLEAQLEAKLLEEYGSLNCKEIEYAFRSYGPGIEDYGKVFNLNLLEKVLQPYIHRRAAVREFTSRQRVEPVAGISMQADWRENCELCYQDFLSGNCNIWALPWQLNDEFEKSGMMEPGAYKVNITRAKMKLIQKTGAQKIKAETMGQVTQAREYQAKLERISTGTEPEVEYLAKRMAVHFLYSEAKKAGMKNLFTKE